MKILSSSLFLLFAVSVFAADPYIPIRVDLKAKRDGFGFESYQAEQTTVRVYFYNDGSTWSGSTNYGGVLGFGTNYGDSTSMVLSSNTWTATTNYLDFSFTASQLNTNGTFYAQLMVTNVSGSKWVFDEGRINIKKSPISGGATAQVFTIPVNWDIVENLGTVPWPNTNLFYLASNPSNFLSSIAGLDHSTLSNLAWTASGHTGTAARIAGFLEGGAAGEIIVGAGLELDGSDNLNVISTNYAKLNQENTFTGPTNRFIGAMLFGWHVSTASRIERNTGTWLFDAYDGWTEYAFLGAPIRADYGLDITGLSTFGSNINLTGNSITNGSFVGDASNLTNFPANDTTTTNMTNAVTVLTATAGSSNAVIANTEYVDRAVAGVPAGLTASTVTNITRDAWHLAYEITAADGTATVARSYSDVYYDSFTLLATGETVIAIDTSTFPTNGDSAFSLTINPDGNTISVDSSSVDTNSWADITLTTNAYNKLIFERAPYETIFYVWGRP